MTIELRRKRSKTAQRVMSVISAVTSTPGGKEKEDPFQPDFANDILLAKFVVSSSYLARNCHNKLKKGVFVWQPAQAGTQVTGIASLQLYRHSDEVHSRPDLTPLANL